MNETKVNESYENLKQLINSYGYTISFSTIYFNSKIQTGSAVDHGRKTVITMPRITEREIIGLCHELGHIIDRRNTGKKRNRNKKSIKLYEEILAWVYAIPLLIKLKTSLRMTLHSIYYSLLSYLKFNINKGDRENGS